MLSCQFSFTPENATFKDTGLGNVMFQIASIYGISNTLDRDPVFHNFHKIRDTLSKYSFTHCDTIFRNIETVDYTDWQIITEPIADAQVYAKHIIDTAKDSKSGNISIDGYLESFIYFDHIRPQLMELFSIDNASMSMFQNSHPILFDDNITRVSVHVRQHYGSINYIPEYFVRAMDCLRTDKTVFIFFSNDIEWCKTNFQHLPDVHFIHSQNDYEDMWAMTLCHHYIICHSTLGWWGAYLSRNNEATVYYPSEGLRIDVGRLHPHPVNLRRLTEHYKPEWITLDCPTF